MLQISNIFWPTIYWFLLERVSRETDFYIDRWAEQPRSSWLDEVENAPKRKHTGKKMSYLWVPVRSTKFNYAPFLLRILVVILSSANGNRAELFIIIFVSLSQVLFENCV